MISYFSMAEIPRDLRQEIHQMSQGHLVVSESKQVLKQTNKQNSTMKGVFKG